MKESDVQSKVDSRKRYCNPSFSFDLHGCLVYRRGRCGGMFFLPGRHSAKQFTTDFGRNLVVIMHLHYPSQCLTSGRIGLDQRLVPFDKNEERLVPQHGQFLPICRGVVIVVIVAVVGKRGKVFHQRRNDDLGQRIFFVQQGAKENTRRTGIRRLVLLCEFMNGHSRVVDGNRNALQDGRDNGRLSQTTTTTTGLVILAQCEQNAFEKSSGLVDGCVCVCMLLLSSEWIE